MSSPSLAIKLQEQGMKDRAAAEEAARKARMNPQPIDASTQQMSIAQMLARKAGIDKSQEGSGKKPAAKKPAAKKPAAKKPAAKKPAAKKPAAKKPAAKKKPATKKK
jgi:hypothetical protein